MDIVPSPGPSRSPAFPSRSASGPPRRRAGGRARRSRRSGGILLLRRATVSALAATLLVAGPAAAHPFVRGGEIPVDSLATIVLAMAHGCGSEDSGGGEPTTEIALEVPDEVRIVEIAAIEGFDVELETDEQGRTRIVTWRATTSEQAAPAVSFDAVVAGEPGDEMHLKVFQGCPDFTYRWIGTPDEPAEDPAVTVTLGEPDPDRPAPESTGFAVGADGAETSGATADQAPNSSADGAGPADRATPDEQAVDDGGDVTEGTPDAASSDEPATRPEDDGPAFGGAAGVALVVLFLLGAGVVGLLAVRRRRGGAADA